MMADGLAVMEIDEEDVKRWGLGLGWVDEVAMWLRCYEV